MSNYKGFVKMLPYANVSIPGKVRDAWQTVGLLRGSVDAISGRVADAERCMNANCTMRHANDGTFPHPVYAAWFIKSMAYILVSDKPGKKGLYDVVRYRHRNWSDIEAFDKTTSAAERVRKFGADKKIMLYPIPPSDKLGARPGRKAGKPNHGKPTGRIGVPRGVNARLITLRQWQEAQQMAGAKA